jgi:hypothetical protein
LCLTPGAPVSEVKNEAKAERNRVRKKSVVTGSQLRP